MTRDRREELVAILSAQDIDIARERLEGMLAPVASHRRGAAQLREAVEVTDEPATIFVPSIPAKRPKRSNPDA